MTIKQEIEKILKKSLSAQGFDLIENIKILEPEEDKFGDYATNVAFLLAKKQKKDPREIAKKLQKELLKEKTFEKVEIAGNGFINLFLAKDFIYTELKEILEKKEAFFQLTPDKKDKIQVEFISANPTGPLHLGHGRNGFYGDVLARVLKKAGHNVEREFYVNDAKTSTQITELGKTALKKGEQYKSSYLDKIIDENTNNLKDIQQSAEAGYLIAHEVIEDIKNFVNKLKIKFDKWFSEETLYQDDAQKKLLKDLEKKGLTYKKEGALWLKTSQFGDDKDRVIVRSSGDPTYFLSDILYHKNKIKRGFNKIIDIWGADHQGHCKKMQALMKILDYEGKLEIPIIQMVHLKTKDGPQKMSKRAGTAVSLKELVDEVGKDVARFMLASKDISTQMVFDLELAKKKSDKNPVYYLQYALVRCKSILRKADFKEKDTPLNLLQEDEELALIKEMLKLPDLILDISQNYEVHHLATYGIDLAKKLHKFYRKHQVLSDNQELSQARLSLIQAAIINFETLFDATGIEKLEKM